MTTIFYYNEEQKKMAEASREALQPSGRFPRLIATKILPATAFYPAEEYHQEYYRKNNIRYKMYSRESGREDFIKKYWG